ncbi:uncharacterized protein ACB058_014294 [Synchiropus picturatus]
MSRAEGSAIHRVDLLASILLACLVQICVSLELPQLAGDRTSSDLDVEHGDSEPDSRLQSEARAQGKDRPKLTGFSQLQFLGTGTSGRATETDDVFLWSVGNVTQPARSPSTKIRFQRDFPGVKGIQGSVLGPFTEADQTLVDWLATTPVVLCSDDVMFFTASGEGLAHLFVDREGAAPISLLHLPSYCGYSVKSLSEDLQVLAAYDACYIIQENGSYVLPLLWSGSPLKLSCPMEMPTPAPSPSSMAPLVFCSPYGMAVQIYEKEEDILLLGVIVNGDWVPFVSAECAYRINSEPEDFIFFIPFVAPCATVKDDVYIQLVSQQEYILLCPVPPELVHPPRFPPHHTPELPQAPYQPMVFLTVNSTRWFPRAHLSHCPSQFPSTHPSHRCRPSLRLHRPQRCHPSQIPQAPYFPEYLSAPQVPYFPEYLPIPQVPYFPEFPLHPLVPSFPESPSVPQSSNTVSLPVRFFNVYTEEYLSLDLHCPLISTPPSVSPPTTPPFIVPKPKVSCTSHQMIVELPPGPMSGISVKECDLPSEKQLKCGPSFPSQSLCLAMGCCFSKTSRACYYPMDECTQDRHFVFSVPATLTDPPLVTALLVAAANFTCTPEVVTSEYAMFKIPMDGCGVRRVVVGKTMIYLLEVVNKVHAISLNYGAITRDSPIRLLVECRYVPGSALTVSYLVKTPSLGPAVQTQGLFGVQLRIAKDAEYSSYHPQYHQPLQMLLGKPLYLELRLLNAPDPSLVLLVHYCVAYPRSGKAVWVLLYNGCPNPLDPAAQQSVLLEPRPPPPQSQIRRFTVTTFQFLPDREFKDPHEEIYFMCSTEICSPSDGPCVEGCFGR